MGIGFVGQSFGAVLLTKGFFMLTKQTVCKNCQYFKSFNQSRLTGECRRRAPSVVDENTALFIPVSGSDWCGEFIPNSSVGDGDCRSCRYFVGRDFDEDADVGTCRKHAPQGKSDPGETFPQVKADDFCWEYCI